ncbi:MAG: family 43 glycosylhydrolase [Bacteroidota bacterium]
MNRIFSLLLFCIIAYSYSLGQSPSFDTFTNPVIPGDHPDCTLTKIGNDFYTTGSSFNPTPVIYHSTDLVHWEAIAQPVSAAWSNYGDAPGGGCWGGQIVYYNNKYWDFFGRAFVMYFVTADKPEGPWSTPILMNVPSRVPGFGADNSIFIDDDGKWYLLVKNGRENNWIVELGSNGQPQGAIYDLRWLNPAPSYPYSWAEGPVMWKHNGYYYYSFARDVGGGQKVFRSTTLTDDKNSWENLGDFFNESDPLKYQSLFQNPNHSSAAIELDDGTSWVVHPVWRRGVSNEWLGQGRQGLLNQVIYDANDKPIADYPVNQPKDAPKLPSSGIPWMVPHSDFFDSVKVNPEWSFLGYTPNNTYSLTDRPGWLRLSPKSSSKANTVIKNDGEHNYSLITRLEFDAMSKNDEAGLRIIRGDATKYVKLASSLNADGKRIIFFSFENTRYEVENSVGDTLWLRMIRVNHKIGGYYSSNGNDWVKVGQDVDISSIDSYTDPGYQVWEGTRQGLYVQGSAAFFDLYIYRDAHTPILAECPANQLGTTRAVKSQDVTVLDNIHANDWALYAGVEFGSNDYPIRNDSLIVTASSVTSGNAVEVWLDSLDTGTKIAECTIGSTGSLNAFNTFTAPVSSSVSGKHDVYLKFTGTGTDKLFQLRTFYFSDTTYSSTSIGELPSNGTPKSFYLGQNYPNPFNPSTTIQFSIPRNSFVTLRLFDALGKHVNDLVSEKLQAGDYRIQWNAQNLASGVYFYRLMAGNFSETKKTVLLK